MQSSLESLSPYEEEAEDEEEVKEKSVQKVSTFFTSLQAQREVSIEVMTLVIEYLKENKTTLSKILEEDKLPSFDIMRRKALSELPVVFMDIVCLNPDVDEDDVIWRSVKKLPRKEMR